MRPSETTGLKAPRPKRNDLAAGARAEPGRGPATAGRRSRRCRRPRSRAPEILPAAVVRPAHLAAAGVERVEVAVVGAEVDGRLAARHLRDGGRGVDVAARALAPRELAVVGRERVDVAVGVADVDAAVGDRRAWSRTGPSAGRSCAPLGARRSTPACRRSGGSRRRGRRSRRSRACRRRARAPPLTAPAALSFQRTRAVARRAARRRCRSRSRSRGGRRRTAARTRVRLGSGLRPEDLAVLGAAARPRGPFLEPSRTRTSRRCGRRRRRARRRRACRACASSGACRCACRSRSSAPLFLSRNSLPSAITGGNSSSELRGPRPDAPERRPQRLRGRQEVARSFE